MTLASWTSQSPGWDTAPAAPLHSVPAADVLGEIVVDRVRPVAAALHARLSSGEPLTRQDIAAVAGHLSYREVFAGFLLALDCADPQKIGLACRESRTADEISEDYAWLRDGGLIPDVAAQRCGIRSVQRRSEYETRYQAERAARREVA